MVCLLPLEKVKKQKTLVGHAQWETHLARPQGKS